MSEQMILDSSTLARSHEPGRSGSRPGGRWRSTAGRLAQTVGRLAASPLRLYRQSLSLAHGNLQIQIDREIAEIKERINATDPEAIVLRGRKVYSQFDEDGIIEEIFARIGETSSLFIEIGCGNGLENNTHYLLLKGWRGLWIDANERNIDFITRGIDCRGDDVLAIERARIARGNVDRTIRQGLGRIGLREFPVEIDFLSVDIDGNDLDVLTAISAVRPRVICVEYNAKFPPPMRLAIAYDETHSWAGDDYHGASLQALVDALEPRGYRLACCGLSGVNAFFVEQSQLNGLPVKSVEEIYQPPRYHLIHKRSGHLPSLKFLRNVLGEGGRVGS